MGGEMEEVLEILGGGEMEEILGRGRDGRNIRWGEMEEILSGGRMCV